MSIAEFFRQAEYDVPLRLDYFRQAVNFHNCSHFGLGSFGSLMRRVPGVCGRVRRAGEACAGQGRGVCGAGAGGWVRAGSGVVAGSGSGAAPGNEGSLRSAGA